MFSRSTAGSPERTFAPAKSAIGVSRYDHAYPIAVTGSVQSLSRCACVQ